MAQGALQVGEIFDVASKSDLIVFLCPNGHRLNGPASLEGKPGQCPHCGVKFRVPSRDDPPDEEEAPSVSSGSSSGIQVVDTVAEVPGEEPTFNFSFEEPSRSGSSPSNVPPSSGISGPRSTMADIFTRLWDERERGSVAEIYLANGQVIVPERYARDSSRKSYGVFAVRDPDGTYTVTAINWAAIAKVSVRHLSKLPKKMFD